MNFFKKLFATTSFECIVNVDLNVLCFNKLTLPGKNDDKNVIQCEDILDLSPHCINWCPFKWLLECNDELICVHTNTLILPGEIFLRHDIKYTSRSAYDLYSNLSSVYIF